MFTSFGCHEDMSVVGISGVDEVEPPRAEVKTMSQNGDSVGKPCEVFRSKLFERVEGPAAVCALRPPVESAHFYAMRNAVACHAGPTVGLSARFLAVT